MRLIPKEISTAVGVCTMLLIAACGEAASSTVSGEGFGPVRFGMKVEEAEKALGVKLQQDNYSDHDECRYFTPVKSLKGLAFMTENGVIVRLDVDGSQTIETNRGAKIGDSEQRVLELYKGARVEHHFYTGPEGHYVKVTGRDGKVQLVFETDGAKVVSYRAGREPQVLYVEGCSC